MHDIDDIKKKCQDKFSDEKQFHRFYTHLGESSSRLLVELMEQVDKFYESSKDSGKNEVLTLEVKSHALKRQLARDIAAKYRSTGNLFTEFKKNSDNFVIKKWAKKNDYGSKGKGG